MIPEKFFEQIKKFIDENYLSEKETLEIIAFVKTEKGEAVQLQLKTK